MARNKEDYLDAWVVVGYYPLLFKTPLFYKVLLLLLRLGQSRFGHSDMKSAQSLKVQWSVSEKINYSLSSNWKKELK